MRALLNGVHTSIIVVAGVLLLGACTGGGAADGSSSHGGEPLETGSPAANPGFSFPAPSELPVGDSPRTASYTEESLFEEGYSHEPGLPHQNYDDSLPFTGEFAATAGNGLNGAAYAMFLFTVDGYDRLPQLRYRWQVPPDPIGAAYIGLANFTDNRWDWWQCDEFGWFSFGDIGPYTRSSDDAMIAAVVVAGATTTANLRYLRLGPQGVKAVLTGFPATGIAPFTATLSGSSSTCAVGNISDYFWDFDGSGSVDLIGADATAEHLYSEPGIHRPKLTVQSSRGELDSDTTQVTAYAPWTHSWGGGDPDRFLAVDADDSGIYAAGWTRSYSNNSDEAVLLVKYGLDGSLEWARSWSGSVADFALAVETDNSGSVYIAGTTQSFGAGGQDVLIQRWDTDGNLLWTTIWGGPGNEKANAIDSLNGMLYLAGITRSFNDSMGDALLLACDESGNAQWSREVGIAGAKEEFNDVDAVLSFLSMTTTIYAVGGTHTLPDGGVPSVLYTEFADDGTLEVTHSWGYGDAAVGLDLHFGGPVLSPRVSISGHVVEGSTSRALVLEAGFEPLAVLFSGAGSTYATGIDIRDGSFFVSGYDVAGLSSSNSFLARFSGEGSLESLQWWTLNDVSEAFHGMTRFPDAGWILCGLGGSAEGEWTADTLTPEILSEEWTDYGSIYFHVPEGAITGNPQQAADQVTDAVLDVSAGPDQSEALLMATPW